MSHAWRDRVRDFQSARALMPDGDIGEQTWLALERELADLDRRRSEEDTQRIVIPTTTDYSYGGPPIRKGVDRDPGKLLPGFARRVEQLFRRMRTAGFAPILWEGYRTPARAIELERRGTGIAKSMHCLGAAVDIVDSDDTPWTAPPGFWGMLRREAEQLSLHVLRTPDGRDKDLPHVQAVPVVDQVQFWAMTLDERKARVDV